MAFSIIFIITFIIGFAFGLAMPFILFKFPFKEKEKKSIISSNNANEIIDEWVNGKIGDDNG